MAWVGGKARLPALLILPPAAYIAGTENRILKSRGESSLGGAIPPLWLFVRGLLLDARLADLRISERFTNGVTSETGQGQCFCYGTLDAGGPRREAFVRCAVPPTSNDPSLAPRSRSGTRVPAAQGRRRGWPRRPTPGTRRPAPSHGRERSVRGPGGAAPSAPLARASYRDRSPVQVPVVLDTPGLDPDRWVAKLGAGPRWWPPSAGWAGSAREIRRVR